MLDGVNASYQAVASHPIRVCHASLLRTLSSARLVMTENLPTLVGQVTRLNGRALEVSARLRRDTDSLAALHNELATLLDRLWILAAERTPAPATGLTAPRVIRLTEVRKIVGLAPSTIWKMVGNGRFPSPRRLGPRSVGWLSTDLDVWITSRTPSASQPRFRRSRGGESPV